MSFSLRRPRYADIVGTLALLVAMGGTAYAATELPRDSVGAQQIRDKAVRSPEIKDGQVKTADLAAASVGSAQLQVGAANSATIQDDSVTLSDLKGIDISGPLTLSVGGNFCGSVSIAAPGLEAGQSAFLTVVGAGNTQSLLFGPVQVIAAGQASATVCNLSSTAFNGPVGVRLVSLG